MDLNINLNYLFYFITTYTKSEGVLVNGLRIWICEDLGDVILSVLGEHEEVSGGFINSKSLTIVAEPLVSDMQLLNLISRHSHISTVHVLITQLEY